MIGVPDNVYRKVQIFHGDKMVGELTNVTISPDLDREAVNLEHNGTIRSLNLKMIREFVKEKTDLCKIILETEQK